MQTEGQLTSENVAAVDPAIVGPLFRGNVGLGFNLCQTIVVVLYDASLHLILSSISLCFSVSPFFWLYFSNGITGSLTVHV